MPDRTCTIEGCPKRAHKGGMCDGHRWRLSQHGDPLAGGTGKGELLRFAQAAATSATDECIIWPYARTKSGYGTIRSRRTTAHRLVLEMATGPAPGPRLDAAHAPGICHNRLCVNPRHLRWASRTSNLADREADGTAQRGVTAPGAKLTEVEVRAIRADQRSHAAVARQYGVSSATVSLVRRRLRWAWLD